MKRIDPKDFPLKELHQNLLSSVGPRPIAFASTLSESGTPNLSPFSFFNAFGSNPPIVIFSPARRGRDNTTKDTYENIKATKEAVVHIVTHDIVEKAVLTSSEYPETHDEFEKAGFTKVSAEKVGPYRARESPVHLECRLRDLINYAEVGGAANLAICEVVMMHINEEVIGTNGFPDPFKMDHIGRLGQNWYTRSKEGLFEISAPPGKDNIGFDHMPSAVKTSPVLTGNELAKLGRMQDFPPKKEVEEVKESPKMAELYKTYYGEDDNLELELHKIAKVLIDEDKIEEAWRVLLGNKY